MLTPDSLRAIPFVFGSEPGLCRIIQCYCVVVSAEHAQMIFARTIPSFLAARSVVFCFFNDRKQQLCRESTRHANFGNLSFVAGVESGCLFFSQRDEWDPSLVARAGWQPLAARIFSCGKL